MALTLRVGLAALLGLILQPIDAIAGPVSGQVRPGRPAAKKRPRPSPRVRCRDIFCSSQVLRLDGSTAEVKGLTAEQVEDVMQNERGRLEGCLVQARRRDPTKKLVRVEFVVNSLGKVLAVRVDGKRYSNLSRCVGKQMSAIRFPTTNQPRMVAAVTLAVPE